ncbi:MAG: hypothetical protein WBH47_00475 [Streptosporangiaceae bacterium]
MSALFLDQGGIAVEVQGPALRAIDTVSDRFRARAVPVDVPVLQFDPRAVGDLAWNPTPTSLVPTSGVLGVDGVALRSDWPEQARPQAVLRW